MNFSLKSFTFGAGTAMIVISIVFYCVYSFSFKAALSRAEEPAGADESALIVEKATKLGMVFADDISKPPEAGGLSEAPYSEGLTDDEIVDRAIELGMVFGTQSAPASELSPDDGSTTDGAQTEDENEEKSNEYVEPPTQQNGELIDVYIRKGLRASEIAETLAKAGVVDDEAAFLLYLTQRQATKNLREGSFSFPAGSDYGQVLNVLKGNR